MYRTAYQFKITSSKSYLINWVALEIQRRARGGEGAFHLTSTRVYMQVKKKVIHTFITDNFQLYVAIYEKKNQKYYSIILI